MVYEEMRTNIYPAIIQIENKEANSIISDFKKVITGVLQDTILGQLLFILYVNDLLDETTEKNIVSYADDTAAIANKLTRDKK